MSSRIVIGIVIIALIGGVGYFLLYYKIETHYGEDGKFSYMKIAPRNGSSGSETSANPGGANTTSAPLTNRSTFTIATYNLAGLDEGKLSNARIGDILTQLFRRFDLIAVEGMRGKNRGVPARMLELFNAAGGRQYDFVTCPTQQRDGIEHFSGFFFDKAILEVDISTVRFVEDLHRRFRHKPLTGLFRTRTSPSPFTFYMVAVDTDPEKPQAELDLLAEVFRAVRDIPRSDGPSEDDVIMVGGFEADERHLGLLATVPGINAVIADIPTTTRGTKLADNILFDRRATTEFTGRAEVVDMMREFELTVQAASEISEHLPVWAEFSVFEGGPRGYLPRPSK